MNYGPLKCPLVNSSVKGIQEERADSSFIELMKGNGAKLEGQGAC